MNEITYVCLGVLLLLYGVMIWGVVRQAWYRGWPKPRRGISRAEWSDLLKGLTDDEKREMIALARKLRDAKKNHAP